MAKYLVSASYDGSKFCGWAKQIKQFTVQGFIEKKIGYIFSRKISLSSSSRTDKNVHAVDQKFTFDLGSLNIEPLKVKKILNKSFEGLVQVNEVIFVHERFELRKEVFLKEYRYFIILKDFNIFNRNYFFDGSLQNINVKMFQEALKVFEGKHNFFNFSYVKEKDKLKTNTSRLVERIVLEKVDNFLLCISFFSKGFLRYQIRAILGECLDKHNKENGILILSNMLESDKTLKYTKIAPPSGLYLWKVSLKGETKQN